MFRLLMDRMDAGFAQVHLDIKEMRATSEAYRGALTEATNTLDERLRALELEEARQAVPRKIRLGLMVAAASIFFSTLATAVMKKFGE